MIRIFFEVHALLLPDFSICFVLTLRALFLVSRSPFYSEFYWIFSDWLLPQSLQTLRTQMTRKLRCHFYSSHTLLSFFFEPEKPIFVLWFILSESCCSFSPPWDFCFAGIELLSWAAHYPHILERAWVVLVVKLPLVERRVELDRIVTYPDMAQSITIDWATKRSGMFSAVSAAASSTTKKTW